jgi:hypothetical protein
MKSVLDGAEQLVDVSASDDQVSLLWFVQFPRVSRSFHRGL